MGTLALEFDPRVLERFWAKVDKSGSCWIWKNAKNNKGYGVFGINGKLILSHRFSYQLFKGDISNGLELDHLCRNPVCVNPDHLEAVTKSENAVRGLTGKIMAMQQSKKTHCPKGHELKEPNLRKYQLSIGKRACRICHNLEERHRIKQFKISKNGDMI